MCKGFLTHRVQLSGHVFVVCLTHWNESPSGKLLGLQPQHPASGLVCGRHINVYWMMERRGGWTGDLAGFFQRAGKMLAFLGTCTVWSGQGGDTESGGDSFSLQAVLRATLLHFLVVLCPRSAPIRTRSPLSVPGELCTTPQVAAQLLLSPGHLLEPSLDWFRAPPLCSHGPCPPQPHLCGRHYLLVCLSHRL